MLSVRLMWSKRRNIIRLFIWVIGINVLAFERLILVIFEFLVKSKVGGMVPLDAHLDVRGYRTSIGIILALAKRRLEGNGSPIEILSCKCKFRKVNT